MSAPRGRRAAERLAPERSTTSRGTVLVSLGAVVVCLLGLVGAGLSGRPTGVSAPVERTERLSRNVVCQGSLPESRIVAGSSAGQVRVGSHTPGKAPVSASGPTVVSMDRQAAPGRFATAFAQAKLWLAATACPDPAAEWWFVGAGGSRVHRGILRLTNPLPGDAVADVTVIGPDGPVRAPGLNGITVAAGDTKVLRLAQVAPSVGDLAVHVVVSRGLLASSMDESWASSFTAKKVSEWVPGQPGADKHLVFGGLADKPDGADLVIANPGEEQADVTVSFVDDNSTFAPTKHATVTVPPMTVTTTPLGDVLRAWPQAIRLDSDKAISATVRSVRGADESLSGTLAETGSLAVAGVPTGVKASLRVISTGPGGRVTAVFRGPDGQAIGSREFTLKPKAAITVDVPAEARSVALTGGGRLRGALVVRAGDNRIATVPLESVLAETRVPQVRPAW